MHAGTRRASTGRRAWQVATYRLFYAEFVVLGLASSSGYTLIALFLSNELHVGTDRVGLFMAPWFIGPGISVLVGLLSDRMRSRVPLVRAGMLWLALGWSLLALSASYGQALAVSLLFLSAAGILDAQLFAICRDFLQADNRGDGAAVISTLRGGSALGYVVGPVAAGYTADLIGVRQALGTAVLMYILGAVLTGFLAVPRYAGTGDGGSPRVPRRRFPAALLLTSAGVLLVASGDGIKLSYLPLYVVDDLQRSASAMGSLLAVAAVVELVAFPALGVLADRLGEARVIAGALLIGSTDYAVLAHATRVWELYVVQVLHAVVIVGIFGVGISWIQKLGNDRAGLWTSVYIAAASVANPLGGLIGSFGVHTLGLPGVFWIPSVICFVCFSVMSVAIAASTRREVRV